MLSSWLLGGQRERKKGLKKGSGDDDCRNLALVKAAAWAWYQRGSGSSEGKSTVAEFDVARSRPPSRPSRYMVEAMRAANEVEDNNAKEATSSSTPVETRRDSLLDSYEIQSISKQLGSLMEEESARRSHTSRGRNGDSGALLVPQATAEKVEKNRSGSRALIARLRQYGPVTCGALKDVEVGALVRRRWAAPPPTKRR